MDRKVSTVRQQQSGMDSELEIFRDSFRAFLDRDVGPLNHNGSSTQAFAIAGEHGFLGVAVPEEHGGAGVDDTRFVLLAPEQLAEAGMTGLALGFAAHAAIAAPILVRHADPGQRARWLPRLASGELVTAVAGRHPSEVRLTPTEGGLVLNGAVQQVVNTTRAGLFVVPCRTVQGEGRFVLVEPETAGVDREPSDEVLGAPGADLGTVRFTEVAVGEDKLLLGGDDSDVLASSLDEQLALAAVSLAGARAAVRATLGYVRERSVFGRPVISFQNTRYVLAELITDLTIAETYLETCTAERTAGHLTPERAAAAKLRCSEVFVNAADSGLQLHGGYGYMREYPISQAFADARYLNMYGGSSAALKETVAHAWGLSQREPK